jgi:sigma-B regulation protein RsbU (phosphoserine phosphatase)
MSARFDRHEHRRAARVHYSFMPEDYADERLQVAVCTHPFADLGGGYCSILPLRDGRVVLCLCDAVGHDIASALYAARINTFVLAHAPRAEHPCEVVEDLNAFLSSVLSDLGLNASFFVAFLDPRRGAVDFAGAGHPPALHYRAATGQSEALYSEVTLLGVSHPPPLPCAAAQRPLRDGDRLVSYTDGVIECSSAAGEQFGIHGLQALLTRFQERSSAAFNRKVLATLSEFKGSKRRDDILMLTASVGPSASAGDEEA